MAQGKTKNIALLSHATAGKTSLAESILHKTGAIDRLGTVDSGNTTSDYHDDEKERKISINSAVLHANHKESKINIIDTPGYADFIGEAISGLRGADCGLLVVCGVNGVEVGTDRAWRLLKDRNMPAVIFVNKLDKEHADFFKVLDGLKESFGIGCVPFSYPMGKEADFKDAISLLDQAQVDKLEGEDKDKALKLREKIIEAAAEADDALTEKYLEGKELTQDEIISALKKAAQKGNMVPVLCGSAASEIGVDNLLDVIVDFLPSSSELPALKAAKPGAEEEVEVERNESAPFLAQCFKSISDPYVGQLTVFRVYTGKLSADSSFYNISKDSREKFGHLYLLQGKEQKQVDSVAEGDIAAVAKLKVTTTSDTLCDEKNKLTLPEIEFPEPVISLSIKPKARSDEDKISEALSKLSSEDPTFKVSRNVQTREEIISGMGDLHLDVMISRLKKNYGVDVEVGTPKVAYKSTITKKVQAQGRYKKQSGGRGQYGDCWIEIEPLEKGAGFEFENAIVGGAIPKNYIPAVEKGIKKTMEDGVIAGCPLVDVKVKLYDGSYHSVDSSDMAFQIAGGMALKKAAADANPVILEPIMNVEIMVPEDYMGQISGDLSSRRGRIMGMEAKGGMQVVKAQVPLSEMFKYASELRSMTHGQGAYSMKFSHYEQAPGKVAQDIIDKHDKELQEAEK